MKKRGEAKWLAVVSDIHVGSINAPWPDGYKLDDGGTLRPGVIQQFTIDCWNDYWAWVKSMVGRAPLVVVNNGDTIEGVHHRDVQLVTNNAQTQADAAVELLKPHVKRADAFYQIRGTSTHNGPANGAEEYIARSLGGKVLSATEKASRWIMDLRVNGTLVNFDHHISCGSIDSKGGALQRRLKIGTLERAAANMGGAGYAHPSIWISGHCHTFGMLKTTLGCAITTPSWKMLGEHERKVVPAVLPQLGGILIRFEPDGAYAVFDRIYQPTPAQSGMAEEVF